MYLLKKHFHPVNFTFARQYSGRQLETAGRNLELRVQSATGDIHHIIVGNSGFVQANLQLEQAAAGEDLARQEDHSYLHVTNDAGMRLLDRDGSVLLEGTAKRWFGVCGSAWVFEFKREPDMRFYGLGEKQAPFERSEQTYVFWNVDVWADHPMDQVEHGDYDPDYISIPYLIIKRGNTYIGLLLDTSFPATISLSGESQVAEQLQIELDYPAAFSLGAEDGTPSLYCLLGPSLAELTRKLQLLLGTTPLPPLWSLGYHQSRWGYRGDTELFELAGRFTACDFPVDGLWLDIDYMDGFRVFTVDRSCLPDPAATLAALRKRGFRVVPILDPGVKRDENYSVYTSGLQENVFCLTETGAPFVGMVWPGFTVFPDFTLPKVRQWWARLAKDFFDLGFDGAWIDMNDPSTGPVDPMAMRFDYGRKAHAACRNQYALLMAQATHEAQLACRPDQRPFLLSRSGSTGSQKYAAHWTGDNFSNYHHLQRSIGKSINLALSGLPFNGADVGGFGGDCSEQLLIDWLKAAFLFPFLRNHTMRGSRSQEPWAYCSETLAILRHYVRLRYRLLPYLYNLFMDQEEQGEAILRPLFYDFADSSDLPLELIDDQFLVGPAIMQAPFVVEEATRRPLVLPQATWLDGETGRWLAGGRRIDANKSRWGTPLFLKQGALIPFLSGPRTDNRVDLNRIGLLCCLAPGSSNQSRYLYRSDDGCSFAYRNKGRSSVEIIARVVQDELHLQLNRLSDGYGPIHITPYTIDRFSAIVLEGPAGSRRLHPQEQAVRLTGDSFTWQCWQELVGS